MSGSKLVLVTGADGLLGRHARAALAALHGAARFAGRGDVWDVRQARRTDFSDPERLRVLASGASVVLHFAGINRASEEEVEHGNRRIAEQLADVLEDCAFGVHVLYANSTHSERNIPYGRGKRAAAEVLAERTESIGALFSDFVLPHVFGEGGRAFYNSAAATLCRQVIDGEEPIIRDGAEVELMHAGTVVDAMLDAVSRGEGGRQRLNGHRITVQALYEKLLGFHADRVADRFPAVSEPIDVALFNTLRAAGFPESSRTLLKQNRDARGTLFEAAKGGAGGQTFLSWTEPGVERGNHFHRYKIERFVVVRGRAVIRIRDVLGDEVHTFEVDGESPVAIDMPTLHTHSIVNTGDEPLLTLFWAHEIFDPQRPDTWAAPVLTKGVKEIFHEGDASPRGTA